MLTKQQKIKRKQKREKKQKKTKTNFIKQIFEFKFNITYIEYDNKKKKKYIENKTRNRNETNETL